jgi:hypothetical protein
VAAQAVLSRRQTERGGKDFWDAEQLDRDVASRGSTRRASPAALPTRGESALAAHGKGSLPRGLAKLRRQAHLDVLLSHELHTGAPVLSTAPVTPEQRSDAHS